METQENQEQQTPKISSYRVGDLFEGLLNADEIELLIKENPGTIGAKYAVAAKKYAPNNKCINLMTKIIMAHIWQATQTKILPPDIDKATVVHLRLGDVIAGEEYHERQKRPLSLEYLKTATAHSEKVYVIGKCFFAAPSSTNYSECIEKSNKYMQSVLDELVALPFDGGHADIDLCCAVRARKFIQGRGYFSKLIVTVRKLLKLESVETETETVAVDVSSPAK